MEFILQMYVFHWDELEHLNSQFKQSVYEDNIFHVHWNDHFTNSKAKSIPKNLSGAKITSNIYFLVNDLICI